MKLAIKRVNALAASVLFLGAILFLPGLPWSARCRHVIKRTLTKAELKISAWQGYHLGLISLSGRLVSQDRPMEGAEVEALDSLSGWAALADAEGEFSLPDLQWNAGASYTLLITENDYQARLLRVTAPERYPQDGEVNLGNLALDRAYAVDAAELPGRTSTSYLLRDKANWSYYRELFDRLTAANRGDAAKLDAINQHVAARLVAPGSEDPQESATHIDEPAPRRVLEVGSRHCARLALAFATLAEAGNYKTRILDLIDGPRGPAAHMVVEVYYGDRWHLYDPVGGIPIGKADGGTMSYRELHLCNIVERNAALPRFLPAHLPAIPGPENDDLAKVFRSGLHHYYCLTL